MTSKTILAAKAIQMLASGDAADLRLSAGLSLAAMASDMGVSAATLWLWENGRHTPRLEAAVRLARYLERLEREAPR